MPPLRPAQAPRRLLSSAERPDAFHPARPRKRQRDGSEVAASACQMATFAPVPGPSLRAELTALVADPVTLTSLRDPYVLGDCGHTFDAQTLETLLLQAEPAPACPLCRTPIEAPSRQNLLGRALVEVLRRYGVSDQASSLALRKGPIVPLRPPPLHGASAADTGLHFCCVGAAFTLATLGLGISSREEVTLRNVCALTTWGVGLGCLLAGYAFAVWPQVWRRGPVERTSA